MQRRQWVLGVAGAGGLALLVHEAFAAALSQADATAGVRAALERGSAAAVDLLGRTDGFLGNPKVRIGLPGSLDSAAKMLKAMGQQHQVDDLVTAMNRAAESAVPEAKPLLLDAARTISVEDAVGILRGGDTAVTDYFARKTREPLGLKFLPIVTRSTQKVSLAEKYNAVAGKAAGFGLVKKDDANIERYVTGKALDGLYTMIGEEEKKIRADPVGTGSALLKKAFGG
jgi:hypothetical protein